MQTCVYKNMTISYREVQQPVENQAGQGKIFFKNVDIM
jgi:hypothetical protein